MIHALLNIAVVLNQSQRYKNNEGSAIFSLLRCYTKDCFRVLYSACGFSSKIISKLENQKLHEYVYLHDVCTSDNKYIVENTRQNKFKITTVA